MSIAGFSGEAASALRRACDSGSMISGALAVVANGRITTMAAAGNLYDGGPETQVSTLFGIGSIVEFLTAAAVARSDKIQFSAWISDYVPGLGLAGVTVEHLLSHTSGLPFSSRDSGPTDETALQKFVEQDIARHHRRSAAGELPLPTPSGHSAVGRALELFEPGSFDDVMKSHVLEPAGMNLASPPGLADPESVAWPHRIDGGVLRRDERLLDNGAEHPSGFLFASLQDLASLVRSTLDGFFIDASSWQLMSQQHVSRHMSHVPYPLVLLGAGFGLGCQVGTWNGQPVVRQSGRRSSYRSSIDILPESSSALVLLTNGADERVFTDLLNHSYEQVAGRGRLAPEPGLVPIEPGLADAWVGTYARPSSGEVVDVAEVDGGLVYRANGVETPLYNVGEGRAVVPMSYGSAPVWFPTSKDESSYLMFWGEPYFRVRRESWSSRDQGSCTGIYRDSLFPSDDTDLSVGFENGEWVVERAAGRSQAIELGNGRLATGHGLLEFNEDGSTVQVGDATVHERS